MSAKILRDRRSKEDFMKKRSLAAVFLFFCGALVFGKKGWGGKGKEGEKKKELVY